MLVGSMRHDGHRSRRMTNNNVNDQQPTSLPAEQVHALRQMEKTGQHLQREQIHS